MFRTIPSLLFAVLLATAVSATPRRDPLRVYAVSLINDARAAKGLGPLELDPVVSAIADRQAAAFLGGEGFETPSYLRYSHAGTDDAINENVHRWTVSYEYTDASLRELVRKSQISMMDETPPYDGRRTAILDPLATHAAIGLAWEGREFLIVQVFLRRYVHWAVPLPRCAHAAGTVPATGWVLPGTEFDAVAVHHEPVPTKRSRRNGKAPTALVMTHALPAKRREYLPKFGRDSFRFQYAAGRKGEVDLGAHGEFSLPVSFGEGPGIYTVVVWVRFPGAKEPFPATMTSIVVD